MRGTCRRGAQVGLAAIAAALVALGIVGQVQAAPPEPDFVFTPGPPPPPAQPTPPPTGYLNGPCGLAVDGSGRYYVGDYYHDAVDVFFGTSYVSQIAPIDPLDGPCGMAVDASDDLYVNAYHRSVARYGAFPSFGSGVLLTTLDAEHPTGVAVNHATGDIYVNDRTRIDVYDSAGTLTGQIGAGTLDQGYGLAVSHHAASSGHVYVADASDDTVKIYDPLVSTTNPVDQIDDTSIPLGELVSLRDSEVAVDDDSGDVYVLDNLSPELTERPQGIVHVFDATETYLGHLKYNVVHGEPSGLAVDNSGGTNQGRVYLTSGNTDRGTIYAYPPGAAVTGSPVPATTSLSLSANGPGGGRIVAQEKGVSCSSACDAQVLSGSDVSLAVIPNSDSTFAGFSGAGCGGSTTCTVRMDAAKSVSARFEQLAGPPAASGATTSATALRATSSEAIQKGALRVTTSGRLSPRKLPRRGTAPIKVSVGGKFTTTDGSLPPQLKSLKIELNRHGRLETTGLPECRLAQIQPASTRRALKACRRALVGDGSFSVDVVLSGQEPYPTSGRLLVFNGKYKGKPALLGQIYSAKPFANSFVIPFQIHRRRRGPYGLVLTSTLPKALTSWGHVTGLQLNLKRRYGFGGKRRSVVSAGCPAPKGFPGALFSLARTTFRFAGGVRVSSGLTRSCRVREGRGGG